MLGAAIVFGLVMQLPATGGEPPAAFLPLRIATEFFAIGIGLMIFGLAWGARSEVDSFDRILGSVFLAVTLLNLAHALSLEGAPVLADPDHALSPTTRLLVALALAAAAVWQHDWRVARHGQWWVLGLLLAAVGLVYALSLWRPALMPYLLLPAPRLEQALGVGIEVPLMLVYLALTGLLWRRWRHDARPQSGWLTAAAWLLVLAEAARLFETQYTDRFALLGHVAKVLGYALVYRALLYGLVESPLRQAEQQSNLLRTVYNAIPDMIWAKDRDGAFVACNPAFERYCGRSEGELLGQKEDELLAQTSQNSAKRHDIDRFAMFASGPSMWEEWLVDPDGEALPVETVRTPIRDADGNLFGILGIARDLRERLEAENRTRLYSKIFASVNEGIMITDANARIVDVNQTFTEITGYSRDEVIGRNPKLLKSGRQDPGFYEQMWQTLLREGHWRGEIWSQRKNGEQYAELLNISAVYDSTGEVSHYIGLFSDISRLKEQQERLELLAHYDALTRLPNRILLADRLQLALNHAARADSLLAVCYLDLDGFKPINDKLGHDNGDRLLIEVAQRLTASLRDSDTVARLGGDEFVLLLNGLDTVEQCEHILQRLLDDLSRPYVLEGAQSAAISASIGVALYPTDGMDPDTLLRHADQAMYLAKQAGRNRYHLFDSEYDRRSQVRYAVLSRLEEALEAGEFRLHYQPRVDMRRDQVAGVEALIRWQHPERGLLEPAEFLPDIENTDLAVRLGDWVLEQVLRQLEAWQAQGLELAANINISGRHLQQRHFSYHLKQLLRRHPSISANRLQLEVLETAALDDMGLVASVIGDCHELGVSFALDDFGTGYSSLTYLKRLPADVLKIDRSFVRDMLEDPEDLAIVDGIVGLAQAFRREVVAEGVETVEHGVLLLQLGCDQAQGYGIARPMPAEMLPGWVESYAAHPLWAETGSAHWPRGDLPLLTAELDHRRWIDQLVESIERHQQMPPPMDIHDCRFGHWHDGMGRARYGHLDEFRAIDPLHRRVHALGQELIALRDAGRYEEAQARLPVLLELRAKMLACLRALLAQVAEKHPRAV
ncbi:MAG: EAL domain-containing protein [Candidatus Competibacterales bacterium]|nr:EAL domain-containing protein [Candidatus Competibacterales bacterium]